MFHCDGKTRLTVLSRQQSVEARFKDITSDLASLHSTSEDLRQQIHPVPLPMPDSSPSVTVDPGQSSSIPAPIFPERLGSLRNVLRQPFAELQGESTSGVTVEEAAVLWE